MFFAEKANCVSISHTAFTRSTITFNAKDSRNAMELFPLLLTNVTLCKFLFSLPIFLMIFNNRYLMPYSITKTVLIMLATILNGLLVFAVIYFSGVNYSAVVGEKCGSEGRCECIEERVYCDYTEGELSFLSLLFSSP